MSDTSMYSGEDSDSEEVKRMRMSRRGMWSPSDSDMSSGFRSPARKRSPSDSRHSSMGSSPTRNSPCFSRSPSPALSRSTSPNRSFSKSPSPFKPSIEWETPSPSRQSSKSPSPSRQSSKSPSPSRQSSKSPSPSRQSSKSPSPSTRSSSPFYSKSPPSYVINSPLIRTRMTRSKPRQSSVPDPDHPNNELGAGSRNANSESSDKGIISLFKKIQDKNQIRDLKRKLSIIENERDVIKKSYDSLQEDKDSLNNYLSFIKKDRNAIKKDRDLIREDRDAIKSNRNTVKAELASLQHKYSTLTYKLREHVECPVCLDVPTSGPIYTCPNGHFVCPKCKGQMCPTCRGNMSNGKSLLAVTVIENIDHECSNDVCEETLPLAELKLHRQCCPHRSVLCPALAQLCGKKLPLSKVYDHIIKECAGSYNRVGNNDAKNNGQFPKHFRYPSTASMGDDAVLKGYVFFWSNQQFYLSFEKFLGYTVLSLSLLGAAEECREYEVMLAVHRTDDEDMKGKHVQKFTGEPLPIESNQKARRHYGLLVGTMQLEKIEVDGKIGITLDIKKTPQ